MARFGTAINCMDGRVQLPVTAWLKEHYQVDYVDMITEAGPVKALAERDEQLTQSIRARLEVSLKVHKSEVVAVVGHDDCASNPVGYERHQVQVQQSVDLLRASGVEVPLIGLYVHADGTVEQVW